MRRYWIILLTALCLLAVRMPLGAQGEFFIHTVRWYESLKDISKKYDVPVDVIMEINGLDKPKVKSRMKLKIPVDLQRYYSSRPDQDKESAAAVPSDSLLVDKTDDVAATLSGEDDDNNGSPWNWGTLLFGIRNKVKAAIVLPLEADESGDNYFDFYSGALMAVRELGHKGINTDITVINTSTESISPATANKLKDADFIIGPVSAKGLANVLSLAGDTPVISPLDPRAASIADSTENFVQAPTASSRQYADIAKWILEERAPSDNLILISETGSVLSEGMKEAASILTGSGIRYKKLDYTILQGRNITSRIESSMEEGARNRVLVLSEKEAFVNDVVRNLNLMLYNKFDVILYSTSRIRSFDTIETENLHSLNLHVSTSYYIDYDDPKVKNFVLQYRALFNTEPTQFAFQGYDVTAYFTRMCDIGGSSWYRRLAYAEKVKMLQADFDFVKKDNGGYMNTGTRRIIYCPDYSVKEISH